MKKSHLTELIRRIVKKTLNELDSGLSLATTGASMPSGGMDTLSSTEQQKMERMRKQQAQKDLKIRKKELDQAKAKQRSLEQDYKMTRRFTVPNMKKGLDAQKRAITKM